MFWADALPGQMSVQSVPAANSVNWQNMHFPCKTCSANCFLSYPSLFVAVISLNALGQALILHQGVEMYSSVARAVHRWCSAAQDGAVQCVLSCRLGLPARGPGVSLGSCSPGSAGSEAGPGLGSARAERGVSRRGRQGAAPRGFGASPSSRRAAEPGPGAAPPAATGARQPCVTELLRLRSDTVCLLKERVTNSVEPPVRSGFYEYRDVWVASPGFFALGLSGINTEGKSWRGLAQKGKCLDWLSEEQQWPAPCWGSYPALNSFYLFS